MLVFTFVGLPTYKAGKQWAVCSPQISVINKVLLSIGYVTAFVLGMP